LQCLIFFSIIRIDHHGIIKVADFGLSRKLYEKVYFRQGTPAEGSVKLPIKWMAVESITDRIFSEKTDVVSVDKIAIFVMMIFSY
jgi:hypothetical protein